MVSADVLESLREIVGAENVLDSPEDLDTYAYDATSTWFHRPDVVVMATSTEEGVRTSPGDRFPSGAALCWAWSR